MNRPHRSSPPSIPHNFPSRYFALSQNGTPLAPRQGSRTEIRWRGRMLRPIMTATLQILELDLWFSCSLGPLLLGDISRERALKLLEAWRTVTVRGPRTPVRLLACLIAGLVAFPLLAAPPSALLTAQTIASRASAQPRQEEARRFLNRRGVLGHSAAKQLAQARRSHATMTLAPAGRSAYAPALLSQPWQALGPAQVSTSAYGMVTGRVTSIAADPSDATGNTVYLGATGGGVWKSTNAAGRAASAVFTPLTDNLPAFTSGSVASLSIGAVSVQPGGAGVILAGTGDPNDALDSYYGAGLLRSADGGLTWSLISESNDFSVNSFTNFHFFGLAFAGFAWSSQTPNLVVAAVSQSAEGDIVGADLAEAAAGKELSIMGLYYSTDAGQTWLLATITDGPGSVVQSSATPEQGGWQCGNRRCMEPAFAAVSTPPSAFTATTNPPTALPGLASPTSPAPRLPPPNAQPIQTRWALPPARSFEERGRPAGNWRPLRAHRGHRSARPGALAGHLFRYLWLLRLKRGDVRRAIADRRSRRRLGSDPGRRLQPFTCRGSRLPGTRFSSLEPLTFFGAASPPAAPFATPPTP